ncbi:MAG: ribulose-phosphate 3-epimerase [Bacteroidia bacterium]|nr:ribulose-phosphate 3-epimerase [Bacteroidia bacterium]MDW8159671.1 ribulose-phosphate 3-epimerase [Bacteroidia bacterium]
MQVSPSIIATEFLKLSQTLNLLNESEADYIHCDIMDGNFVPNLTFGMTIFAEIAQFSQKPLEAHLMIQNPEKYIPDFQKAGAQIITIHYEGNLHVHRTLNQIKSLGCQAGLAINPSTPIECVLDLICEVDIICLMSVNPGFYGQPFIPRTLSKIQRLKNLILQEKSSALIEVDGGVTFENIPNIAAAGADIVVAGNTVFRHPKYTIHQAIAELKKF